MSRPFLDLGDGLEVRHLDPVDADELQTVIEANRERLRRWMSWAEGSTLETTRAFIEANEGLDPLGIALGGALVGAIGARPDPMRGDAELGYWIAETHERRGLVTRSCRALIEHLFSVLGLHRVTILAAPDNVRSRAVAERLGSTEEGRLREAGWSTRGYHDLVVYGLLEHEWTRP